MKPYLHAKNSAKRWGGVPEDYLEIHNFMDSTKSAHASVKHRAILHNSFGIFLAEKVFGINLTILVQDGEKHLIPKKVSVRDIAEQHVIEDLGTIPSLDDWLKAMTLETWMGGPKTKETTLEEICHVD